MKYTACEKPIFECLFGGIVQIISPPSMILKVNGKGIYRGPISVLVTGSTAGGAAGNATGTGVILPTAMKGQNNGMGYLREGDKGYITVFGSTSVPNPTVGVEVVTVKSCKQSIMQSD